MSDLSVELDFAEVEAIMIFLAQRKKLWEIEAANCGVLVPDLCLQKLAEAHCNGVAKLTSSLVNEMLPEIKVAEAPKQLTKEERLEVIKMAAKRL